MASPSVRMDKDEGGLTLAAYIGICFGVGSLAMVIVYTIRRVIFMRQYKTMLNGRRPTFTEIMEGVSREARQAQQRSQQKAFVRGSKTKIAIADLLASAPQTTISPPNIHEGEGHQRTPLPPTPTSPAIHPNPRQILSNSQQKTTWWFRFGRKTGPANISSPSSFTLSPVEDV